MWRWMVQPIPSLIDRKTKWQYEMPSLWWYCMCKKKSFLQLYPLPSKTLQKIFLNTLLDKFPWISSACEPPNWWVYFWFFCCCYCFFDAEPLICFCQVRQLNDLSLKMKHLLSAVTPTHHTRKENAVLLLCSHSLSGLLWEEDLACFGMVELFGLLFDVRVRDRKRERESGWVRIE